jgi:four helix bundle protein
MARGDDIEERLVDFAVRIINLSSQLPKNFAGNHISNQILRSGTAPAANYAEARNSESLRDFIHKLRISLKELNETRIWLKMIIRSNMQLES